MKVISERTNFKPLKRRTVVKKTPNRKNTRKSSCTLKQHRATVKSVTVPQELLSRFPSALQEINRRIMAQNFMWLALKLEYWGKGDSSSWQEIHEIKVDITKQKILSGLHLNWYSFGLVPAESTDLLWKSSTDVEEITNQLKLQRLGARVANKDII